MKFCQRRTHEYKGINNIITSAHYINLEDVISFHGKPFADKWLEFIKTKPLLKDNSYYYEDDKFAARQTDSYFNPQ